MAVQSSDTSAIGSVRKLDFNRDPFAESGTQSFQFDTGIPFISGTV